MINRKLAIPANPLIYKSALQYAAVFFEAGRSSGLTSQYKTPEEFAKRYVERFLPMVIKNFIQMLKPDSGISRHMKDAISEALLDPVNDPNLMTTKPPTDTLIDEAIARFDKGQLKFKDLTPKPKQSYKQKILNTANPLASTKGN